jgi:hypothetical protein
MSPDQFTWFMESQHDLNLKMSASLGRLEETTHTTNVRLFGGDGQQGAMPKLYEKITTVETRVGTLEGVKNSTRSWIAGALAVFTLEGTALGIYFSKVAAHTQALQQIIKHQ